MLAGIINFFSEPFEWGLRMMGRQTPGVQSLKYENPAQMIAALHNPATEASAVARMKKMHYGLFYGKQSRGMFSGLAESELSKKGPGVFGFRAGALQGRPMMGLSVSASHLKWAGPAVALQGLTQLATSKRRHRVSGLIGGFIRGGLYAVGDAIGTAVAGPAAGLAAGIATEEIGAKIQEGIQLFTDFNRSVRHINMGGNYEDSKIAYTMRQRAAQEIGSSVMNARQWLGKESLLMHQ